VSIAAAPKFPSNWQDIADGIVVDLELEAEAAKERESKVAAVREDVREFAKYVWLNDPNRGPIPFDMWDWQLGLLDLWANEPAVCVLKARQLGVSWLVAVYVVWRGLFNHGQRILLVSIGQREADKLLEKCKFIIDMLPDWLKPPVGTYVDNVTRLRFDLVDSEIESLPASGGVGRSRSASLVVLDEHAWQARDREIWTAIKATVEHGSIISISTANGLGPLHTRIYKSAKQDKGRFIPVFIPWSADPRRNETWYEAEREEYELAGQGDEFVQEYPANDEEAFIVTGSPVFSAPVLLALPQEAVEPTEPGLWVYRRPEPGARYAIGCDTSEGVAGGDWSSATVLKLEQAETDAGLPTYRAEQVAQLRGRWEPEVYAKKVDALARYYAKATERKRGTMHHVQVGVERNNHGHAVLVVLRQLNPQEDPYTLTAWGGKVGWLTNKQTRPIILDTFAGAVRAGDIAIHDPGTISQMSTFSQTASGGEAQSGYHDDDVLAAAIAFVHARRAFGVTVEMRKRE